MFQDNERLVHRIQQVYKYTRQVRKERKFLMDRLDNYGDNWRQGIAQLIQDGGVPHSKSSSKHKVSCFFCFNDVYGVYINTFMYFPV